MKDHERLEALQLQRSNLEARQMQLDAAIDEKDMALLLAQIAEIRAQIAELSTSNTQQIDIDGSVGAASIVGSGSSLTAGAIISGNTVVVHSSNPDSPFQAGELDYLAVMIDMNSRLSLDPLDPGGPEASQENPQLIHIYIPLNAIETAPIEGEIVAKGETRQYSVVEAIAKHTHLVILGGPGTGKSTVLKHLTWYLATMRRAELMPEKFSSQVKRLPEWQDKLLLPVLITLTSLAQWLTKNDQPTIENYLDSMLTKLDLRNSSDHIRAFIRRGDAILLLDGLDEVPNQDNSRKLIKVIEDFVDRHPDMRVVITCRTLSYTNPDMHLKGFTTQTLATLTNEQVRIFIQNWYDQLFKKKKLLRDVATKKAKSLERIVNGRLSEFSTNPLLLTIMLLLYEKTGDLPHEKARLYHQCCEMLMWRWEKAKLDSDGEIHPGISESLGTSDSLLMSAFMRLAYEQYECQQSAEVSPDILETEVLRTFRPYFSIEGNRNRADSWRKAAQFLEYIQDRAGLLVAKGKTGKDNEAIYAFIHRTFQEFLAGRYLTTQRYFARRVVELFLSDTSDRWYEVVLLATGHFVFNNNAYPDAIDAAKNLVQNIRIAESQRGRAIWWAAEILAIVGRVAIEIDEEGKDLLPIVHEKLVEVLIAGELSPRERMTAGEALARIGDPRASVMKLPPQYIPIPGGSFIMGMNTDNPISSSVEHPSHTVPLSSFTISKHPVTNAQYRLFIEDGGYTARHHDCWTPQGWAWKEDRQWGQSEWLHDPSLGTDNKPIVGVSWFEAVAYTRWLSKSFNACYRLPTEAEWERAARGIDGRIYPWGDNWLDEAANTRELGLSGPTSVGIFPLSTSLEGCTDMIGNVWEWCQSLFRNYPYRADDGREDLDDTGPRIARGGCYNNVHTLARCAYRLWRFPGYRNRYIGFRVVQDTNKD